MTGRLPASAGRHDFILPALAAALFVPLFIFRSAGPLDFWTSFGLTIALLCGLTFALDPAYFPFLINDLRTRPVRKVILGALSAAALYGVFFAGNALSRLVWPGAAASIGSIYGFKSGAAILRITALLALVIGPGEEIFWRGYLQRAWAARRGKAAGWLLASGLYALVHAGSLNPLLILAAAACGLYWGFLFNRFRSPLLLCVSHTLWDIAVFVVLPFA